ncbi:MAG: hypothetical protein PHD48_00435 [Alphaproteobacteria bacterium]|nr:hypothetical protein [Alphaproteobacteria bacterium]
MSKSNTLRNTLILVIIILAGLAIYKATMTPTDEMPTVVEGSSDVQGDANSIAVPEPETMIEKAEDAAEAVKKGAEDAAEDVKEGAEDAVDQMQQTAPTIEPESPEGKTE